VPLLKLLVFHPKLWSCFLNNLISITPVWQPTHKASFPAIRSHDQNCMQRYQSKNHLVITDMSTTSTDMTQPNYPSPRYHSAGHEIWTQQKTDFFTGHVTRSGAYCPDRISKQWPVHAGYSVGVSAAGTVPVCTQLADPLPQPRLSQVSPSNWCPHRYVG